jgi:tRNA pseudouridine38-40 synthase
MARYRATVAYDGANYQGFQRQPVGIPTVQACVEAAIERVTRQAVTIIGAGRTDSGVHASGQVIAFDVSWSHPPDALLRALNKALPEDIALQEVQVAPADFHPRYSATGRTYRYTVIASAIRQPLLRRVAWRVPQSLDHMALAAAAALLVGEHDFAAFGHAPHGTNTMRRVDYSAWTHSEQPYGWQHQYEVCATAFLHHMVRRMVGLMVDVGRGRRTLAEFEAVFRAADIAGVRAMAPPHGLVLEKVHYPDDHRP